MSDDAFSNSRKKGLQRGAPEKLWMCEILLTCLNNVKVSVNTVEAESF